MEAEGLGFEVIFAYSRAEAIADGVLRDVSEAARREGFRVPVAVTAGAWAEAVAWDGHNGGWQDEEGRLTDVLVMASAAIRANRGGDRHRLSFTVARVPNTPGAEEPEDLELAVESGPGDNREHVLTIMLPSED